METAKEYKWHYIVGIGVSDINCKNPGETYLDFFLEIEGDMERVMQMEQLMKNCADDPNSVDTPKSDEYNGAIRGMSARCVYNNVIACCFHSDYQWSRELMETYVKHTPLEKLKEAKIRI